MLTDNSTYIAGVGCLSGTENFWFIYSTEPEMSPEILKTVKKEFKERGYTAPPAVEGKSLVVLKKLVLNYCRT